MGEQEVLATLNRAVDAMQGLANDLKEVKPQVEFLKNQAEWNRDALQTLMRGVGAFLIREGILDKGGAIIPVVPKPERETPMGPARVPRCPDCRAEMDSDKARQRDVCSNCGKKVPWGEAKEGK